MSKCSSQQLARACTVAMLKSCLVSFLGPSGNFDLNMFMTPFAWSRILFMCKGMMTSWCCSRCWGSLVYDLKGPVFKIPLPPAGWAKVITLLLLWTSLFVLWVICYCYEYFGLCCELFVIAVIILVCAVTIFTPYNVGSVLWRLFSTLEVVQYIGGITSVLWGIASELWGDSFSTVGG